MKTQVSKHLFCNIHSLFKMGYSMNIWKHKFLNMEEVGETVHDSNDNTEGRKVDRNRNINRVWQDC
jgi:hypothetical protein